MEIHLLKEKVMHSMTCMIFWDVSSSMYESLRLSIVLILLVHDEITVFDLFPVWNKLKRIHQDSPLDMFTWHTCVSRTTVCCQHRHDVHDLCSFLILQTLDHHSEEFKWKCPPIYKIEKKQNKKTSMNALSKCSAKHTNRHKYQACIYKVCMRVHLYTLK